MKRLVFPLFLFVFAASQILSEDALPWPVLKPSTSTEPLPGTDLLDWEGDLSLKLVEANDRFLDRMIERAAEKREQVWNRDFSSPEAYVKSVEPNRKRLTEMLGLDRDERPEENGFLYISQYGRPIASAEGLTVHMVQWKAIRNIHGVGFFIEPQGVPKADVILLPDVDEEPGITAGVMQSAYRNADRFPGWGAHLARNGCRVLVPFLIDREENDFSMTNREWLHRPSYELGRSLLGYEVHKLIAAIDCLSHSRKETRPIGVAGSGEGGFLAMLASALDDRVDSTLVSGGFSSRDQLWKEPAEHNLFGFVSEFGTAEIASLVLPRSVTVEIAEKALTDFRSEKDGSMEVLTERPEKRGKPFQVAPAIEKDIQSEFERLRSIAEHLPNHPQPVICSEDNAAIETFGKPLGLAVSAPSNLYRPNQKVIGESPIKPWVSDNPFHRQLVDDSISNRVREEQIAEIEAHNQWALIQSETDRRDFFKDLKTDSLEAFEETIEPYREYFRTKVVGDFELPLAEPNVRTRPYQEGPKTFSYKVVMDVFDESAGEDRVFAYGILTLPKDLDILSGEKRPVVVCQHGLEGTPQQVVGEEKFKAYKAFATRLAERGFITFAPQNGYKYFDLFRLQQFKAQSIGKTLFSIIVPQHQQITDWLVDQPFIDPDKIAFYGLSYGGKSAMRIPPLVDNYCLSICSADFNDWVWKNAATDPASLRYSYANKGEYEIFEWNLGGMFNYSEMAALICPRPFMVERGHFDGVAPDERVAYEFAKVRNLYEAKLGLADRCEIEWFVGPHAINEVGTYDFLHKHLDWPGPYAN